MKITESIIANVSLRDVEEMIKKSAATEEYDVVRVTPEYQKEYSPDPRDGGLVTGYKVTGFKVDLKRKPKVTPRTIEPATRDWFDINDR